MSVVYCNSDSWIENNNGMIRNYGIFWVDLKLEGVWLFDYKLYQKYIDVYIVKNSFPKNHVMCDDIRANNLVLVVSDIFGCWWRRLSSRFWQPCVVSFLKYLCAQVQIPSCPVRSFNLPHAWYAIEHRPSILFFCRCDCNILVCTYLDIVGKFNVCFF